jgi:DNA polymerase-4
LKQIISYYELKLHNMFDRAILHLDLDAFFASVECLKNSALKGRPLIIGGRSGRGVVASCSYEARAYGIRSAMPVKMALRLCPDATVIRGDMDSYSKYSELITHIIEDEVPLFEKSSIDEFYVDLTGMDRHFGCWKWSQELRKKIMKESGLPISLGLSTSKLVSKVGTGEAKPNGMKLVDLGTEKQFLAPLLVKKLPSVGQYTYKKLSFMGIRKVQQLSQVPPQLLEREFGKHGRSLWKKANAIDDSPVVPYHERQSISTENTFQIDTTNVHWLKERLRQMVSQLAFELRQSGKLTSNISIKIRYSDFNTYTKQRKLSYTANDNTLLLHAQELFDQLYQRRQMLRLIGVKFSGLVQGQPQLDLFDTDQKELKLMKAMDGVRRRFGAKLVARC